MYSDAYFRQCRQTNLLSVGHRHYAECPVESLTLAEHYSSSRPSCAISKWRWTELIVQTRLNTDLLYRCFEKGKCDSDLMTLLKQNVRRTEPLVPSNVKATD